MVVWRFEDKDFDALQTPLGQRTLDYWHAAEICRLRSKLDRADREAVDAHRQRAYGVDIVAGIARTYKSGALEQFIAASRA